MAQGVFFREKVFYQDKVQEQLTKFEDPISTLYDLCSTFEETKAIFMLLGVKSDKFNLYYLDSLASRARPFSTVPDMNPTEFNVLIVRVAHELGYKDIGKFVTFMQKKSKSAMTPSVMTRFSFGSKK